MRQKLLPLVFALLAFSSSIKAGGLLTNTNQSIAFLRSLARNGAIGIDGVYSNPAGVAFLPNGLHISFNVQKRLSNPYHQLGIDHSCTARHTLLSAFQTERRRQKWYQGI